MNAKIKGKIWKYGDDINTDIIFPGKYTYTITEPKEMAQHALEDVDPSFAKNVMQGDILVVGKNFGCGSSREQAVLCLKYAGISVIIAKSFARIFFRNAINLGLPIIVCPKLFENVKEGDLLTVDFSNGIIIHNNEEYQFPALPPSVLEIIEAGGLIPYVKMKVRR